MKKQISLYIHIPFCESKCFYCDFLSFSNKEKDKENYIISLCEQLETEKDTLKDYEVRTIFIGGGTPSVLNENQLEKLLSALNKNFDFSDDIEFSIECNPGSLMDAKVKVLKKYNINRVSLGLQALQDDILKNIGRIHTKADYIKTLQILKDNNITNINTDVMFGLPNQTLDNLDETLQYLINQNTPHISAYSLTLEEGTPFYRQNEKKLLNRPSEELERKMSDYIGQKLKEHGYNHYEISNYAKDGMECKHNLVYWDCKEYLGFGIGAHSYFKGKRFRNTDDINEYIQDAEDLIFKYYDVETLDEKAQIEEFMFLGLRKIEGINTKEFKERFNKDIYYIYKKQIDKFTEENLLTIEGDYIKLTSRGIDISNIVMAEFLL